MPVFTDTGFTVSPQANTAISVHVSMNSSLFMFPFIRFIRLSHQTMLSIFDSSSGAIERGVRWSIQAFSPGTRTIPVKAHRYFCCSNFAKSFSGSSLYFTEKDSSQCLRQYLLSPIIGLLHDKHKPRLGWLSLLSALRFLKLNLPIAWHFAHSFALRSSFSAPHWLHRDVSLNESRSRFTLFADLSECLSAQARQKTVVPDTPLSEPQSLHKPASIRICWDLLYATTNKKEIFFSLLQILALSVNLGNQKAALKGGVSTQEL